VLAVLFDAMINEANASSSACRLWRICQVETSAPPQASRHTLHHFPAPVKSRGEVKQSPARAKDSCSSTTLSGEFVAEER
jgi:hypothetical protein